MCFSRKDKEQIKDLIEQARIIVDIYKLEVQLLELNTFNIIQKIKIHKQIIKLKKGLWRR